MSVIYVILVFIVKEFKIKEYRFYFFFVFRNKDKNRIFRIFFRFVSNCVNIFW